jgi:hypothetical protein
MKIPEKKIYIQKNTGELNLYIYYFEDFFKIYLTLDKKINNILKYCNFPILKRQLKSKF